MNKLKAVVFSADDMFAKDAEIGQINSVRIIETMKNLGKFSMWVAATKGNLDKLIKDDSINVPRIVVFTADDGSLEHKSTHSRRNYILGTTNTVQESNASGTVTMWPLSSDGQLQLIGKKVTFSAKAQAASSVTGTNCKLKLTYKHYPDNITPTDGELVLDFLSSVGSTPKKYSITGWLPDIGLEQLKVEILFESLSTAVTVSEVKLELGTSISEWSPAPEDVGNYRSSNMVAGIIERVALEENEGFKGIVIEGSLLEKVIDYRCIWKLFAFSGTLRNLCIELFNTQLIEPTITERTLTNVEAEVPETLSTINVDIQKTGGSVLEFLYSVFADTRYGVTAIHDYIKGKIRLYVFEGKDRSASQDILPSVVFTRKNGLLIAPQYEKNALDYKNVALVAGEGSGSDRVYETVGTAEGWLRKEVFIDGRDLQKKKDDGTEISTPDYIAQLVQRGKDKLAGYTIVENFTSNVNTSLDGYVYKRDYFLGDTVTLYDELYDIRLDAPIESVETTYTPNDVTRNLRFGAGQLTLNQKLRLRFN